LSRLLDDIGGLFTVAIGRAARRTEVSRWRATTNLPTTTASPSASGYSTPSTPRSLTPRAKRLRAPRRRGAFQARDGQTISQPFIVALMKQLLALRAGDRMLEVGTGCGHQAAVLLRLAANVTSVAMVPALELRARQTLAALDVATVELHVGNGQAGWPPGAPYDAVIATAAAESVPPAWLEQLVPGGHLRALIAEWHGAQYLQLWRKDAAGDITRQRSLAVRFVPLVDAAP
jgi:protein-L-isoaspartate(D-aspartate) O-methyltransferase